MRASFDVDHSNLASDSRFAEIAKGLSTLTPIDSADSFNRYCREACRLWQEQFRRDLGSTEQFKNWMRRIDNSDTDVIRTGWGGVVITRHEPPLVEKYLVVRKGGYLALEMHEQKDERLEMREGGGLILWRPPREEALSVNIVRPYDRFHFEPGSEHCLIGTQDLLIFERSTDPKGMDQDLIFIFEPDLAG
jgi:hypothetical protein